MTIAEQRAAAIAECLNDVRTALADRSVDRDALEDVFQHLVRLGRRSELFPVADFPPPPHGERSAVHLLSEDDDHGNALYVVSEIAGNAAPPHDHKTWAVIVGIAGEELNRIYERIDDGSQPGRAELRLSDEIAVAPGAGVAFMPEDIHSIHCFTSEPTLTLHLYGQAIDRQSNRVRFDMENGSYEFFEPNQIRK